jgi:hypothetical protein
MQRYGILAAVLMFLWPVFAQAIEFPDGTGELVMQSYGGSDLQANVGPYSVRLFYGGYSLGYNFQIDGIVVLRIGRDTRTSAAQQVSLEDQVFVTPLAQVPAGLKVSYSQGWADGKPAHRLYVEHVDSNDRVEMIVFVMPMVSDPRVTDVDLSFTMEIGW